MNPTSSSYDVASSSASSVSDIVFRMPATTSSPWAFGR